MGECFSVLRWKCYLTFRTLCNKRVDDVSGDDDSRSTGESNLWEHPLFRLIRDGTSNLKSRDLIPHVCQSEWRADATPMERCRTRGY